MKPILYILALIGLLWSCQKEPQFPDPGLDATRDVRDTVRRDTIDKYPLSMHIKAPNGVELVQVLDGRSYEEIANFSTEYQGKKDFVFTYDVDLASIKKDSTLHYVVKVVDKNMRSYNKGFSLRVLGFSEPIITVGGTTTDGKISMANNYLLLKTRFSTGMNTVQSYRMSLDGVLFDSHTYTEANSSVIHKEGYVLEDMTVKNKDYVLRIEMTDNKGASTAKEIILRMMDLEKPIKVKMNAYTSTSPQLIRELTFQYSKSNPEQLNRIDGLISYYNINGLLTSKEEFKYEFDYNTDGMVTAFRLVWKNPAVTRANFTYLLDYDASGRLRGWSGGLLNQELEWTVTDWLDDGRIKGFQREASVNKWTWNYEEGLFAEYDLGASSENNRVKAVGITSWAIPTFLSGLPPIEFHNPSFNSDVLELLMYKNGFEKLVKAEKETGVYVYTADAKGRLQSMRRKASNTAPAGREYIFEYAN